jgi:hypothetical protein
LTFRRDHNFSNLIAVQEIGFIKIFWRVELDNSSILEFVADFVAGNLLYCATAFRIASKAGAGVLV